MIQMETDGSGWMRRGGWGCVCVTDSLSSYCRHSSSINMSNVINNPDRVLAESYVTVTQVLQVSLTQPPRSQQRFLVSNGCSFHSSSTVVLRMCEVGRSARRAASHERNVRGVIFNKYVRL